MPANPETDLFWRLTEVLDQALLLRHARDRRVYYVSPAFERVWEAPVERVLGDATWLDAVVHPDDQARVRGLLTSSAPRVEEFRLFKADGTTRWLRARVFAVGDQDATYLGLSVEDVSAGKYLEAELRLRTRAVDAASQGLVIADARAPGRPIVYCNFGFETLSGYARSEVIGRELTLLQGHGSDRGTTDALEQAMAQGRPLRVEVLSYRKDRSAFWTDTLIAPIADEAGVVRHFVGVFNDITDKKYFERVVQSVVREREVILGTVSEAIYGVDSSGLISFANHRAAALPGYAEDDLIGISVHDVLHPVREDGTRACGVTCPLWSAIIRREQHIERDGVIYRSDGAQVPVEIVVTPVPEWEGIDQCVIVARDITERKHAENLRTQFVERVIAAQEEERRRISRELHDELSQSLTMVLLGLSSIKDNKDTLSDLGDRIAQLCRVTEDTLEDLHRLARNLRPGVLDDMGFVAALERYSADYAKSHEILVDTRVTGFERGARLPPTVETALYRICQEALTNVAKHAKASTVSVLVERDARGIRVIIEDDGQGFDDTKIGQRADGSMGNGLLGMRERAALLRGSVDFESMPGAGSTIYVTIPLGDVSA